MKTPKCKSCGEEGHYAFNCWRAKRKPIKKIGKKTQSWIERRSKWITDNPPDKDGYWICYLQIHPWCPKWIDIEQLTLDHEQQGVKRSSSKLSPACVYCNGMKGSRNIEQVKA